MNFWLTGEGITLDMSLVFVLGFEVGAVAPSVRAGDLSLFRMENARPERYIYLGNCISKSG